MARNFTNEDEGKRVLTADGDMVGTIDSVKGTTAHVTPDAGLSKSIRRRLGWSEADQETYELRKSKVDKIEGDEIHLKKSL